VGWQHIEATEKNSREVDNRFYSKAKLNLKVLITIDYIF